MIDYDAIKRLSREFGRPAETLYVLSNANDPFYLGPARRAVAEWFGYLWHLLKIPVGYHYRRIHYRFVSLAEPVPMLDGSPYTNIEDCWVTLNLAARDAVALGLLPANAFVDRRNGGATLFQIVPEEASIDIGGGHLGRYDRLRLPDLPRLILSRPTVPQHYQVEIWAEKTTVNDILMPLGRQYELNVVTGVGELSATACREFVDRVEQRQRPVRLLYVSDFDPAGRSMPVAVARKIEFELHRRELDLDVQVRPIVLTPEQCVEYRLPRTPLKTSERRAGAFQERFGAGATELDALEALHPGLLRRILVTEIGRYWDGEHDDAVDETCNSVERQLDQITDRVIAQHRPELDPLLAEFEEIQLAHDAWIERAKPVWHCHAK